MKAQFSVLIFTDDAAYVCVGRYATAKQARAKVKRLLESAVVGKGSKVEIAVYDSAKKWESESAWKTYTEVA
jgi:hypothetical protein